MRPNLLFPSSQSAHHPASPPCLSPIFQPQTAKPLILKTYNSLIQGLPSRRLAPALWPHPKAPSVVLPELLHLLLADRLRLDQAAHLPVGLQVLAHRARLVLLQLLQAPLLQVDLAPARLLLLQLPQVLQLAVPLLDQLRVPAVPQIVKPTLVLDLALLLPQAQAQAPALHPRLLVLAHLLAPVLALAQPHPQVLVLLALPLALALSQDNPFVPQMASRLARVRRAILLLGFPSLLAPSALAARWSWQRASVVLASPTTTCSASEGRKIAQSDRSVTSHSLPSSIFG